MVAFCYHTPLKETRFITKVNLSDKHEPLLALQVIPIDTCTANRGFMLSQQALKEFKQIWKEEYQEEISDESAIEKGSNLLVFFDNIYRPIKKDWLKNPDNSNNKTG